MKTYSIWGTKAYAHILTTGTKPPAFGNGTRIPHTGTLHATFLAKSWKHAERIYNVLRETR